MKEKLSLVFTGDIGFDRFMDKKWEDDELISQEVLDFLHSGDHVIANVEGPLVSRKSNMTAEGAAQLLHTMNPEATKVFRKMNADIWNLCNNHMMDAGEMGVECTLKEAGDFGAQTIGAGMDLQQAMKPVFFDEAGGVGLFAVGYRRGCKPAGDKRAGCFLWHETELIESVIREIKRKCRWCIMVVHGGEEFTALPSPYTRDRYLSFLDMGADIIVSHHPHVPMNYETVGDKLIFYSLGNFIFDTPYQRSQFNTEKGILVKLRLNEESFDFDAMGIKIVRGQEHVVKARLPEIFEDVQPKEYELLAPLAAKMFIQATKRQWIYMKPDKFADATEEEWIEDFAREVRSGRVIGEGLDFHIIVPLAQKEKEKAWVRSKLHSVKGFILKQM